MSIIEWIALILFGVIGVIMLAVGGVLLYLYKVDKKQRQHPVLRNFPVIGRARYFLEKVGPEFRQYIFNDDREGKPLSRLEYQNIVKSSKYKQSVLGFGSQRDFEESGYYIRNAMFPKLTEEMKFDEAVKARTDKYILINDPLFTQREEYREEDESSAYLLSEDVAIVIGGDTARLPFKVRGQIGMSAMSYGSLGRHAITALSEGLGMAGGTWMNTGEGGLADYHLKGGQDIIMQIGPGKFGVRDLNGHFDWDELLEKSSLSQVKAFEIKLAQGAKTRGGHVDGAKVTEEIASIRGVEPHKSIDSPNRFEAYDNFPSLFDFMDQIREWTGKPVGVKVVIGSRYEAEELAQSIEQFESGPDFITIDGSEGGTGASYQELADSVGLPIRSALPLVDHALRQYGVREQVKLIASGKLYSPDRVAVALGMGADLVNIARGFMITVGCIQALRCHTNTCPVGVATTNPELEKALVVDEKKHRTANYLITMRKGLFRLAAAAGLDSPVEFKAEHIIYKDDKGKTRSLADIYQDIVQEEDHKALTGS